MLQPYEQLKSIEAAAEHFLSICKGEPLKAVIIICVVAVIGIWALSPSSTVINNIYLPTGKSASPTSIGGNSEQGVGMNALSKLPASGLSADGNSSLVLGDAQAQISNSDIKSSNEKAHTKDDLVANEIHEKRLLKKLQAAATRLDPDKDTEAILRLFRHDVLDRLSPEARGRLDQDLLSMADQDFQYGRSMKAVEKYRQLFLVYL